MKRAFRQSLIPVLTCLLTAVLSSAAQARGGSDVGGGDVHGSTRADLEEVVNNLSRHIWEISDSYLFGGPLRLTNQPLNPDLLTLSNQILKSPYFTVTPSAASYMRHLKFEILSGPCYEGSEERDASTKHQLNAPICLSAKLLARFPKSGLKAAVLPLIFHEIAHQYGHDETEARAFQDLAEIHLNYRGIFLSALRARFECAFASETLSNIQKQELIDFAAQMPGAYSITTWPNFPSGNRLSVLLPCATNAGSAGENLERNFDGDGWTAQNFSTLTSKEKSTLIAYSGNYKEMAFFIMIKALREPSISGYSDCRVCKTEQIDPAYLMMLGAKAALSLIDREVGRLQDSIKTK